ncbi:uncharacterized protein LOC112552191 [Pogonomyrmex barbatus]|uniref:Uncharacterized protein LOC112552191 n=1 Tax=Pogonomyrmex barbatus TaxID=144034 RepID=A0A8N1S3J0_9HYME|nr:uncharacterized protein LOC112552191 [Pogonomyrmex barbatus]
MHKTKQTGKKTNVENFLKLLQDDFVPINKIIEKSMLQAKHRQVQELLSLDDINLLHTFLQTNRRLAFERLNNVFTYDTWQELAQFTLISIQVFNRRRVDEIERMSINDFTNRENINGTNPDLLLSDEARKIAEKYIRFRIRGKFGKPVFVVLDHEIKNCIDLLLQYRKKANIPEENPYIFALPGYNNKKFKFIKACDFLSILLTRMQSRDATYRLQDANFSNHIATRCVTSNLSEHDITQLANYLGNEAINEIILMQLFCHSTNIPRIET